MRRVLWLLTGLIGCALGVAGAETIRPEPAAPALDQLIREFNAGAPEQDGVDIDGRFVTGHEAASRSRDFSSFPDALCGSSGTNSIDLGTL